MIDPLLVADLFQLLRPYSDLLLPVFFICFGVATAIAIFFHDRTYVRQTYITGFVTLLLVFNLISSPIILPLVSWHKFSEERSEERTYHRIHVVDAEGDELFYDYRATLSVDGVTMPKLRKKMVGEFSERKNCEVAMYLLERARTYRQRIVNRSPLHLLRFPPHGYNQMWTERTVNSYSDYVGIRLYRITIRTSDDGSEIVSHRQRLVHEFFPDDVTPSVGSSRTDSGPEVSATCS